MDGPGSVSASFSAPSFNGSKLAEGPRERSGLAGVGDLYPEEAGRSSLPRERPADILFSDETDDQLGLEAKDGIGDCSLLLV